MKAFDPTRAVTRPAGPVKVLFVVSAGRSGSTLIDRLMGQYDQVAAVGELYAVWEIGLRRNLDCGCGLPFRECPMWRSVMDEAFGGMDAVDPEAMERFWRRNDQMFGEHLPALLTRSRRRAIRAGSDAAPVLDALFAAVADETGAELVVDTSKSIFHPWFALGSEVVDPYVLHLVRDPRAVVYSWTRPAEEISEGIDMPPKTDLSSSAWWVSINHAAQRFGRDFPDRYLRLRYEDFVAGPAESVESIGRFCGVDLDGDWLAPGGKIALRATHAGCGNTLRYATELEIRPDERWRTLMDRRSVRRVEVVTAPWAWRWGYGPGARLRRGAAPSR